jgi:hypothetical protein
MKNTTLLETETEDKKIYWLVPEPECSLGGDDEYIPESSERATNRQWKDPAGSRELVKQLLGVVNSEAEYDMLLEDLAELDAIIALQSQQLKGGATNNSDVK